MRRPDDSEFTALVAARSLALRRMAYLMCGDWDQAEDLVQVAFIKLHSAWGRVRSDQGVDAYLRTTLLRACIDERRRAHWRRERPSSDAMPDIAALHDSGETRVSEREVVVAALHRLAPGQRAVLILRFFDDQDVEATARLLGISTGTVKSQTARGLAAMRSILPDPARAGGEELLTTKKERS
ncbi:SigE family RNA polymerase sigma factor [Catenulispora sp. NF23]|uniref:SigE family RNA polymerase sigma factor n=1 Tax=Catenulispora pinistramenti TaxID=2705254 RepID=A0ABS5KMP7_9ACTN|nr:SigE family RNA polymerase sigma factor [Catenulispora pinistramenti]MBS2531400.1 SigE family RNA polymerase sigma factor [Catenulispora pinistramenti]MBS2547332.1 SigE family RNA polymerase sigma factor [Catenulispora pinistramenti]